MSAASIRRPLSIHQITALAARPVGLVKIASETGCESVCIFTHMPNPAAAARFPAVTEANKAEMKAALSAHDILVSNVEFFPVAEDASLADMIPGLALGAELGASRAVCHIHDPVESRAVDKLGQLADLAASHGLSLGLEFMGITAGCKTLQHAAWFVDQVGRSNVAVAVDMLHLIRSGGTADDVAALEARYFSYAQICDGKGLHHSSDYMGEALDRTMPGDGDFPILAILDALPASCPIDVEVPTSKPDAAADWALEAVKRSRQLVDSSTPSR